MTPNNALHHDSRSPFSLLLDFFIYFLLICPPFTAFGAAAGELDSFGKNLS